MMEFDVDILSLAIDSVENDVFNERGSKNSPSSKEKYSPRNPCKSSTTVNNIEVDFSEVGEDEVLALALADVEESENVKEKLSKKKNKTLLPVDLCFEPEPDIEIKPEKEKKSVVHSGDTDSSDDEDNKYFEESRYNEYGKHLKRFLLTQAMESRNKFDGGKSKEVSWKGKSSEKEGKSIVTPFSLSQKHNFIAPAPVKNSPKEEKVDVTADPIFGIRIVSPLVSSQSMMDKMSGIKPIGFYKLKNHVLHGDLKSDWALGAVIVRKLAPKISQNGNQYSMWIISDLKHDLKTAMLFLFGRAHNELWKTPSGTVMVILNPAVLGGDNKKSEYEAKLSIKSNDQVLLWGKSKDLGQCKSKKKNGEICGAFVNMSQCEVCVFHVKQEYNKFNSRADFGNNGNINLRNKVLGKNEVFYGGKSFSAVPFVGKKAVNKKDNQRLEGLGLPKPSSVVVEEKMRIPNLQRSNNILRLLPSESNSKLNDKNRLSSLLSSNVKNTNERSNDVKEPATTASLSSNQSKRAIPNLKELPTIKQPSLSNDGGIEFEFDFIPQNKSQCLLKSNTPELQAKKKSSAVGPNHSISKPGEKSCGSTSKDNNLGFKGESMPALKPSSHKLQKRFNGLLTLSSEIQQKKKSVFCSTPVLNKTESKDSSKPVDTIGKLDNEHSNLKSELKTPQGKTASERIGRTPLPEEACPTTPTNEDFSPSLSSTPIQSPAPPIHTKRDTPTARRQLHQPKAPPNAGMSKAKLKALAFVKSKGPISKGNPTGGDPNKRGLKRPFSGSDEEVAENDNNVLSERFLQLMNQKSTHEDLVEIKELEKEAEYFERLEKKDRLEEKMLNTFKVDCKAVRCLVCKYVWFSVSDACKAEGHPTKVLDAVKRFFKCGKCDNRTISLTLLPLLPCKKCSSSNWVRAPMIKEKIANNSSLSIRGGEQKFVNSVTSNGSLDLLVPD